MKHPTHPRPITALRNLGPQSALLLAAAGIRTEGQLRRLGAVAAYAQVKRTQPNASLNLLWALEGALTDTRWQDVARLHRTSLLLALDQYHHTPAAARQGPTPPPTNQRPTAP